MQVTGRLASGVMNVPIVCGTQNFSCLNFTTKAKNWNGLLVVSMQRARWSLGIHKTQKITITSQQLYEVLDMYWDSSHKHEEFEFLKV